MATQESLAQTEQGPRFVPDVDICDTKEVLWIRADLPGVEEKSVEIHLDNGELSIEGRVLGTEESSLTPNTGRVRSSGASGFHGRSTPKGSGRA